MKTGQKEIIILKSNVDSFSDNGGIWKKYKVISAKNKRSVLLFTCPFPVSVGLTAYKKMLPAHANTLI